MTLVTFPPKTALTRACLVVEISIPLLSIVAVLTTWCLCFPYLPVISPLSTGQLSLPLLFLKFADSANPSGVNLNLAFVLASMAFSSASMAFLTALAISLLFWLLFSNSRTKLDSLFFNFNKYSSCVLLSLT